MGLSKQKSSPLVANIFNKEVTIRNTVLKQCNVISMGLSKQKSSPLDSYKKFNQEASIIEILCRNSVMIFQWVCRNRNPVLLIATKSSIYQEASIIEDTVSKQHNAISMGLSKQKSSPLDSCKKFNQEASIMEILCRNSVMLFQWVYRNRNMLG